MLSIHLCLILIEGKPTQTDLGWRDSAEFFFFFEVASQKDDQPQPKNKNSYVL